MARTTVQRASYALGVPHQSLRHYMFQGKVSYEQVGHIYLVDVDLARQELEEAGYFQRSATYREMVARAAAQSRAG